MIFHMKFSSKKFSSNYIGVLSESTHLVGRPVDV